MAWADPVFPWHAISSDTLIDAAAMALAFIALLFVGSIVMPGRRAGEADSAGTSDRYKFNGLALFLAVASACGLAQFLGWFSLSVLQTHFMALFVVANGFAFTLTAWLYLRARWSRDASQSPGILRGAFFGLELNPTLCGVDLKLFSYRPSLIGLALFNASFAVRQYEDHGGLTLAMALYQAFTFLYVFNYFQFEHGMVHTWDIVSERFGWMLIWGDYVLVPFTYCLAGWWLVDATEPLSPLAAAGLVTLFCFGFWLFRGANEQKHRFRTDAGAKIWGRPAQSLDGRLLISGFWGLGRHLNYTGEILVYIAFTLTTGFSSWVPYLLPTWLAGLLFHRARRDDRHCRAKYGDLWERYRQHSRFSMVPFVY